ncbi:MAG: hypothetical protein LBN03_02040 [Bifidobacteriaceae bacterium]|nr:hypothetical protein [Bifidobacteriaceae bacterium]
MGTTIQLAPDITGGTAITLKSSSFGGTISSGDTLLLPTTTYTPNFYVVVNGLNLNTIFIGSNLMSGGFVCSPYSITSVIEYDVDRYQPVSVFCGLGYTNGSLAYNIAATDSANTTYGQHHTWQSSVQFRSRTKIYTQNTLRGWIETPEYTGSYPNTTTTSIWHPSSTPGGAGGVYFDVIFH